MRETAIVVGAGGALGQAIVADLVAAGVDILGVARNPASLATLAERHGDRFRPVIADMADDSALEADRKSVVSGKSVSVRVDLGGRPIIQTINTKKYKKHDRPNNH